MSEKIRSLIEQLQREIGVGASGGKLFSEVWGEWWQIRGRYSSPRGRAAIQAIGRQVLEFFGEKRASEITLVTAEQYRDARSAMVGQHGRPLTQSTISTELAYVAAALKLGGFFGLIGLRSPPRPRRKGSVRGADVRAILAHAQPWLQTYVLLLAHTGQRSSVIRTLRWADVNLSTGQITLPPGCRQKRNGRPSLLPPALAALRALRAANPPTDVYIFQTRKARHNRQGVPTAYSAAWVLRAFQVAAEKAGVTTTDGRAVLHHLRHGCALEARTVWGWSDRLIMSWVGWHSWSTYAGYGDRDQRELAAAIASASKALEPE